MSTNNGLTINVSSGPLVLVGQQNGVTIIPQSTPLTRLNYFDGKFLRASDLTAEQRYLRRLVELSNQAGGPGVAYGYNVTSGGGDTLQVGPGLAIDPQGRVLLLPESFSTGIQDLIDQSRSGLRATSAGATAGKGGFGDCTLAPSVPPGTAQEGTLYLIVIAAAEALCGQEDVFGKLCDDACATSTDRPYVVEGLVLRALPLQLQTAYPVSAAVALNQLHLRSRVASAYFEDERGKVASFISGDGLHSGVWCLGAQGATGNDVALGVVARSGSSTVFLDAWISRRERIDPPARRYWQWRMAMRPWDVFLAQILQFQCQLTDLFKTVPQGGNGGDPCAGAKGILREANDAVARLASFYEKVTTRFTLQPILTSGAASTEAAPAFDGGLSALLKLQDRLQVATSAVFQPSNKLLIDGGIVELPSAGYLPVTPGAAMTVNDQVRRLMGDGVDLRFCVVRPDYVPHALEEAQHMERISLLEGLDNPAGKPEVDILVPNGTIAAQQSATAANGFEASVTLRPGPILHRLLGLPAPSNQFAALPGAARMESSNGGGAIYFAGLGQVELDQQNILDRMRLLVRPVASGPALSETNGPISVGPIRVAMWMTVQTDRDPFALSLFESTRMSARVVIAAPSDGGTLIDFRLGGEFRPDRPPTSTSGARNASGILTGTSTTNARIGPEPFPAFSNTKDRLTLSFSSLNGKNGITASLQHLQEPPLAFTAEWEGAPVFATAALAEGGSAGFPSTGTFSTNLPQVLFASASAKQNPAVLDLGNDRHTLALAALDLVGGVLGDPGFAEFAKNLLFPPAPPPASDLTVLGTLDWVLFQRRRTKNCGSATTPAPLQLRQYQVYMLQAANVDEAQSAVSLAKLGDLANSANRFTPVSILSYADGQSDPAAGAQTLHSDWAGAAPEGGSIFFAGIAARNDVLTGGSSLANARLVALEDALGDVTPVDGSATTLVLNGLPKGFENAATEGAIFLVTIARTVCQRIYRFGGGAAQLKRLLDLVSKKGVDAGVKQLQGLAMGVLTFSAGKVQPQADTLKSVLNFWNQGRGGPVNAASVVFVAGTSEQQSASYVAQAKSFIDATGGTASVIPVGIGQAPDPSCSSAAFFFAG